MAKGAEKKAPTAVVVAEKGKQKESESSKIDTNDKKKGTGEKRLQKPDEATYQKELQQLDTKIEELKNQQEALRTRIQLADNKGPNPRKELKADRQKIIGDTSFTGIKSEKDKIQNQFDELKTILDRKRKELNELKGKSGSLKSLDKFDQTIREYEAKITAGNLKLIDEKKMVVEISNLKKARKNFEVFEKRSEDLDKEYKELEGLSAQLEEKKVQKKKFDEAVEEIDKQIAEFDNAQKDDRAKITNLQDDRNKIKQQIDELYEKRRESYNSMKQQRDEYRVFQQEQTVKRNENKKHLREQMIEEKRKAFEEKRREERTIPKFVEEITNATNLITYLQQKSDKPLSTNEKTETTETADKSNQRVVTSEALNKDGFIPLKTKSQRDAGDAYFVGKKTAKKTAQPPAASSKTPSQQPSTTSQKSKNNFTIPLGIISQFESLGVNIPSNVDEIEAKIAELKAKKEHFEQKQKNELEKARLEIEEETNQYNNQKTQSQENNENGSSITEPTTNGSEESEESKDEKELEEGELQE